MLRLHDQALQDYGGVPGLRDEGLLLSALGRPVNRLAYGEPEPDLLDLAAAYAFGLAANHPFNDGNKRTAWACCVLFLLRNDAGLAVQPGDVVRQMVLLASRGLDEAGFAAWLRGCSSTST